ncbi:hypothetical protein VTN96DRAFT_9059 [Rasamsonia emersonii]
MHVHFKDLNSSNSSIYQKMDAAEGQKKAVLGFRAAFKSAPWIPISKMQAQSFRERPLKGPILVSKVKIPRPNDEEEEALRSKLWDVFKSKSEGVEKLDPPAPCASSYDGEWIGVRRDVKDPKAPPPDVSEQEKFHGIQQNRQNDITLSSTYPEARGSAPALPAPDH